MLNMNMDTNEECQILVYLGSNLAVVAGWAASPPHAYQGHTALVY
jgi:hypothetical protein